MSVYQKLNAARLEFHGMKLEKSGHNKFAGYKYFELGDFLIPAMQVFQKHGLCGVVSFGPEMAQMEVVNVEKPDEKIVFSSPMGSAQLKGCHEVQNIGAVETYQRRYLWVAALEIVEHDAIDSAEPRQPEKAAAPEKIGGMFQGELDDIAAYMAECHENGKDLDACAIWYGPDTFSADAGMKQEEQVYVWNSLKSYSKLRSAIKANKPEGY